MPSESQKMESLATGLVRRLRDAGFEALFAGGCVRDKLRGVTPKDFDIATSAKPEDIQRLFPKTVPVGVQFGVILVIEEGVPFEVATFRSEGEYKDGRRPDRVDFTDVRNDAQRRDFTVNGLYFDVVTGKVLDFVDGRRDLERKIIRTIGNAEARFREDHLRMLRAARFAVQLGFELEENTRAAIVANAPLLARVSQERIRDELVKTLTSPAPGRGMRLLDSLGLLPHFLPEVLALKGVEQPMEFHPEGDVWIHTLMLMDGLAPNPPIELAMGCLLHDIAKPHTFERAPDRIRFHGHDVVGAKLSRKILKRLTFPNAQIDLICELVRDHLKFKDAKQMRRATLRRFMSQNRFDLHLELHRLDCLASHKDLSAYDFCVERYKEFRAEPPPPQRLLSGEDLIKMGYAPGPGMGKILRSLEDAILEGEVKTREQATQFLEREHPLPKK